MKSRLMFVPAFILVAALAPPAQLVAQQTVSGTNGQIAYNQGFLNFNGGGPANIITVNPDGSNPHQVPLPEEIGLDGVFSNAIWSPDGTRLLISHTARPDNTGQCCFFQPATVNPDGSGFIQLVPPNPPGTSSAGIDCWVWSRDQTRILCAFPTGAFSIRAFDGGDPVQLTTNPYGSQDLPTDISPDGARFVFLRFKPGAAPAPRPFQTQQVALFVANIDGSGLRQITPYGLSSAHEFASATWSPDGKKIIFGGHDGRLYVVHPDGTGIAPIILQVGTGRYSAFEPHWSPDGTRIIFCMFINGGEGIYTANADGSNVVQIAFTTSFANFYNEPDWGTHPLAQ